MPPGYGCYETMIILRPDMTEEERCGHTAAKVTAGPILCGRLPSVLYHSALVCESPVQPFVIASCQRCVYLVCVVHSRTGGMIGIWPCSWECGRVHSDDVVQYS